MTSEKRRNQLRAVQIIAKKGHDSGGPEHNFSHHTAAAPLIPLFPFVFYFVASCDITFFFIATTIMPRQSYKEMVLALVCSRIMVTFQLYCVLPLQDQKILEEELYLLLYMYHLLSFHRYIEKCHKRQRPTNKFAIDLSHSISVNPEFPWLNDVEFLNAYRMTKSAFCQIVRAIENHQCFSRKRGPLQQPIAHQLMTLLHYLGTAGSGASNHRTRNHFHIGYGSVSNYRKRTITAIRETL